MTLFRKMATTFRSSGSALENHLFDELLSGGLDRRAFLRHGSRIGMSLPLMGGLLESAGFGAVAQTARGKSGGTLRIGMPVPAAGVEPVSVADAGGLCMIAQTGEFLALDGPDLVLRPMLATSWKPNEDASVWTFSLRKGVKFHDGREMKADDVVASISRLADPANSSNALSAFKGVLSKTGSKAVDDYTVQFTLDAPNGNFPYYLSSDNYNTIILPADYKGDFEKTFNGTGPFKLEKYTPKVGASFVRNPDYWGEKALPDRTEFSFYTDQQPQILALLGGQVDMLREVSVQGSQALFDNPAITINRLRSNAHRQIHMRTSDGPLADKRVRQAIALTLDRPGIVRALFRGLSDLGNDSPFGPLYPSTDTTVEQRAKNVAKAKELMAAAGKTSIDTTLTIQQYQEMPALAAVVKNAAAEIGVNVTIRALDPGAYYGQATFGNSPWLDSEFGITDYGHRGVPNVYLTAPLKSTGTWNSSHFKNAEYDKLVESYVAAVDPGAQKDLAGKIQRLLLDETPVIFPYFYNFITPTSSKISGVRSTAMSQLFLQDASFI